MTKERWEKIAEAIVRLLAGLTYEEANELLIWISTLIKKRARIG
jgi:hypothetical protein